MEHTAAKAVTWERIPAGRLLRVGVLAAGFSAIANALVLAVASSLFGPVVIPPDEAVTSGQVMAASVAGAVGAAIIFAIIDRFTRRPVRVFWGIAAVGLLLSFLPIRIGRRHGIVCGDVGPYARVGRGHQRRSAHETGPEGVRRDEVTRDVERKLVTASLS